MIKIKNLKSSKKNKALFFGGLVLVVVAIVLGVSIFNSRADAPATKTKTSAADFADSTLTGTQISGTGDDASVKLAKNIVSGNPGYQADVSATDGLISYWKLDDSHENSVLNAINLAPTADFGRGPTFLATTDLGLGGAVDFNSNRGQSISVGGFGSYDFNDLLSVEAWIYNDASYAGRQQNIVGNAWDGFSLRLDSNGSLVFLNGFDIITSAAPIEQNKWVHVVATRSASGLNLYVDSVLSANGPRTNYLPTRDVLHIGRDYWSNYYFDGMIDELRIFNTELSEADIAFHYNNGDGREGDAGENGAIVGWHFNALTGTNQNVLEGYSSSANYDLVLPINYFSNGKYGAAIEFNPDNGISHPAVCATYNGSLNTRNRTLEMWINPDGNTNFGGTGWAGVADNGAAWGTWSLRETPDEDPENSSFHFVGYGPWTGFYGEDLITKLPNNEWHHLSISHLVEDDKATITHFVDGVKVAEKIYNAPMYYDWYPGVGDFCLGKSHYSGHDGKFSGKIDEFSIYNRVLNASDISNHIAKEFVATGEWEQTINLNWNGGWGDGVSDDSTAVSILVSNASAEAKVKFQIKIADNENDLDGALYQDVQIRSSDNLGVKLPEAVSAGTYEIIRKDILDIFGINDSNKKYFKIKAKLYADPTLLISPIIDEVSVKYQADDTAPEVVVSSVGIKRAVNADNPSEILPVGVDSDDTRVGTDGKIWTSWLNNFERGDKPYFVWKNATDSQSGIKAYCLYVGTDPNGDPEKIYDENNTENGFSNMLRYNSPISFPDESGNPTKCQFIVPAMEGEKTLFDSYTEWGNTYWDGRLYETDYDELGNRVRRTYYLNIKAIDNEDNIQEIPDFSDSVSHLEINYDDYDPEKNVDYLSLPMNYVASKAATMTWPVTGSGAAMDDDSHYSGIVGYQYRIGLDGEWRGDHIDGPEDYLGFDIIPVESSSYTFSEIDFPDIKEGTNLIYFKVFDRAGNYLPYGDSRWDRGRVWGALKYDPEAAAPPTGLTATPETSTSNSYAFSWNPPEALPAGVYAKDISYCYTVNTLPSEVTCAYTEKGVSGVLADSFATQPGENTFYVVSISQAGVTRYDDYVSVKFNYNGEAPAFGITNNIDIADISIKTTKNWKLAVSWDKPQVEGAGVATYKILRSETEKACVDFGEIGQTSGTSYVDAGLEQKKYYYCVKACDNANNCGAASRVVSEYPTGKFTEPAKLVDGPNIDSITTSRATITWSTNRESDSKIAYGEKSDDYFKGERSNSDQVTGHSIDLNNLSPGTKYYFKVKWTDEDGNTGISSEKSFETAPAPTVKDVALKNVGISSAFIDFTTKGASKAKIYYGNSASFGSVKEISTSSSESNYGISLDDLVDETKYYYKINTFDSDNKEYEGTTLDFTTLPRPKISDVQIEQIKDSTQPGVHIIWNSNTEISSIVTFNPINDPTNKRNEIQVDLIAGQHEATIMDLLPVVTYSLVVRGIDKAGNEAISETYTFTTASDTRPPVISNIVVEGINIGSGADRRSQLSISWDTDESASSQVEFGEGVNSSYSQKSQKDENLTKNHMVVISGLEPSKVYHLRILSNDSAGNLSQGPDTVTITPKAIDSAYELVVGNLMDIFKFLRKVQN